MENFIFLCSATEKKEMVDASEFLTGFIAKLFEDEITVDQFEIIFANLEQCSACNFIEVKLKEITA